MFTSFSIGCDTYKSPEKKQQNLSCLVYLSFSWGKSEDEAEQPSSSLSFVLSSDSQRTWSILETTLPDVNFIYSLTRSSCRLLHPVHREYISLQELRLNICLYFRRWDHHPAPRYIPSIIRSHPPFEGTSCFSPSRQCSELTANCCLWIVFPGSM